MLMVALVMKYFFLSWAARLSQFQVCRRCPVPRVVFAIHSRWHIISFYTIEEIPGIRWIPGIQDLAASSPHGAGQDSRVAALIAGTADELMAREAIRLTVRPQDWFPARPAKLALQYLVQFPPPMEHSGFHRSDGESHGASSFFHG